MRLIKLHIVTLLLTLFTTSIVAQNVEITNSGNPSEPSIMMNPNDPNILVAGSNLRYYYTSDDGGITWTRGFLESSFGVWGDPVIDVDTSGNFYFFHLSNTPGGNWIDRIVCQKSIDNGITWSDGTYTGLNSAKVQDKEWSIIDRNNNNIYLTWTEFDQYDSGNPLDSSRILFSKSTDLGESWTHPVKINRVSGDCLDGDNTVEGAVPAVGPNGEVYVSWAGPNGIVFNRSTDEGDFWLADEILIDSMPGGWKYEIPGLNRANGLPITKCDLSEGDNHGTIYVNWSDQKNGVSDTDIWLSKSTNGGDTWSAPTRVNNDSSQKHQFLTWMDIDQTNGNLYFVFYDRRNYDNEKTDVYLAVSTDGGNSFINKKISESPFTPHQNIFFGDYTNIVAHNNIIRPIWTRLESGVLSIWTDVTPISEIISSVENTNDEHSHSAKVFPNPTPNISYVSFKLHEPSLIKLDLYDANGQSITTLIDKAEMDYGVHIIPIDMGSLNLRSGSYYYLLSIDGKKEALKTIILK